MGHFTTGGGILLFVIFAHLHATELSTFCTSGECNITTPQITITNHSNFTATGHGIHIQDKVSTFTNYGFISVSGQAQQVLNVYTGSIGHFINYGTFVDLQKMGIWIDNQGSVSNVTNYGIMGSISMGNTPTPLTLNNLGLMGAKGAHIKVNGSRVSIQNYMVRISETAMAFNNLTDGYNNNPNDFSHLVIQASSGGSVRFKDSDSKIILDFGGEFELGEKYLIGKLVTDTSGAIYKDLGVDFSRLTLSDERKDIYELVSSGDSFIIRLLNQITETPITTIYKANIRTMNNFYTISNSMIYPKKSHNSQNLRKSNLVILREQSNLRISNISSLRASARERGNPFALSSLRDLPTANRGNPHIKKSLDSAIPLKSYESFAYRNEAQNRRIQRQNKRSYSRQPRNLSQNLNTDSANKTNKTNKNNLRDSANRQSSSLRADSQNLRGNPNNSLRDSANHDYYFILTPFINHNHFFESGRYNLSGFDYGFLTAFSAKIAESNHLGTHFIMSYGSLGDSTDKNFSITNLNLNVGLNYKLDLIFDMFIKARGDFFYFLNQVSSASVAKTNADNLGFGLSVSYGKEWDFKQGGVLGIEVGIDYKALRTNDISVKSALDNANMQDYKKSLVSLIYADLGANYAKYFGGFGINVGLGFRANLAPKLAKTQLIIANNTLNVLIDNDKFLGYANAGIGYMLNHKDFDMEFSLAYYGNFGDRGVSNGGGVEWRTTW